MFLRERVFYIFLIIVQKQIIYVYATWDIIGIPRVSRIRTGREYSSVEQSNKSLFC